MAFSWILGRRRESTEDTAKNNNLASNQGDPPDQDRTIDLADVRLKVEDGLLIAAGPLGDPLTPHLLKQACVSQPDVKLTLSNGTSVDQSQVLAVLEAQRQGPLAQRTENSWIEAMLGVEGRFESTPTELLAREKQGGQSVLSSRLTVGAPGGETITLCDAHPGIAIDGSKVKLSIDGKATSIAALLDRSDQLDPDNRNVATLEPTLSYRNDTVTLSVGDQIEAFIEDASDIWDGEAKVDLLLSNDQQVSIDDLSNLLKESQHRDRDRTADLPGASHPLLDGTASHFDLSDAMIVMVSGVPDGWWLTRGLQSEQGDWMLDPCELAETSVRLPDGCRDIASIQVQVISIIGHAGTLKKQTLTMTVPPVIKKTETTPNSIAHGQPCSTARLAFDQEELNLAAAADALLLRGVPETASLSAGTYDPSVEGWVLRPAQLDQLALLDLDHQQGSIEVVLKAIYFDQAKPVRTKIIAKKSIANEAKPSDAELHLGS